MNKKESYRRNYIVATLLGALGSGLALALATPGYPRDDVMDDAQG